jgi:hypothetical protein
VLYCSCATVRFTSTYSQGAHLPAVVSKLYDDVFMNELDLVSHHSYVVSCFDLLISLLNVFKAHVFSNNGARVLDTLIKHLDRVDGGQVLLSKFRGVVFDR